MAKGNQQEQRVMLVAALVALVVIGMLVVGFWQQIQRLHELGAAEDELTPLVAYEEKHNSELQLDLERLSAPEYPEEWARVNGAMTRPGEVRVVVQPPVSNSPAADRPGPAPEPSLWEEIWEYLFGEG